MDLKVEGGVSKKKKEKIPSSQVLHTWELVLYETQFSVVFG